LFEVLKEKKESEEAKLKQRAKYYTAIGKALDTVDGAAVNLTKKRQKRSGVVLWS
jgi:hypothetical protein